MDDEYMGGVHKWGYPESWMLYLMENPIQVDDLRVPLFQEWMMNIVGITMS